MIITSIIAFSIETLPNISDETIKILSIIEIVIIVIFTFEYIARVFVADKKLDYILSFYGMVDLIVILPFYLSIGFDLRFLRILRLLRIFQLFKLAKYSIALQRLIRAFSIVKEEMILFSLTTCIMLYLSAVGIYFFENQAQPEKFQSVFHSLWWAITTLTTVGYGDVYPITTGGKVFTFFILMIGLGIIAVPTGLLSSSISTVREDEKNKN